MPFIIPIMFLACLHWDVSNQDIVRGFDFQQPVTLVASRMSRILVENSRFNEPAFCYAIDISQNSVVDVGETLTFSGTPITIFNVKPRE